jgi:hypothetical protein
MAVSSYRDTNATLSPTHPVFRPYVAALGQLAIAWNGLHETLCLLFCTITEAKAINQPTAIWHALKVDRSQRDILTATAESTTRGAIPITFFEDVKWLCGRVDALEDLRNDALHSPYWAFARIGGDMIVMPNIVASCQRIVELKVTFLRVRRKHIAQQEHGQHHVRLLNYLLPIDMS